MCFLPRFVRREKEISLAQCEVSEGEAQRCRQRLEAQEVERKDLQDALNTERDRMQVRQHPTRSLSLGLYTPWASTPPGPLPPLGLYLGL